MVTEKTPLNFGQRSSLILCVEIKCPLPTSTTSALTPKNFTALPALALNINVVSLFFQFFSYLNTWPTLEKMCLEKIVSCSLFSCNKVQTATEQQTWTWQEYSLTEGHLRILCAVFFLDKNYFIMFICIFKITNINWFGYGVSKSCLAVTFDLQLVCSIGDVFIFQAVFLPLLRIQPHTLNTCTTHSGTHPHTNRCSHAWVRYINTEPTCTHKLTQERQMHMSVLSHTDTHTQN